MNDLDAGKPPIQRREAETCRPYCGPVPRLAERQGSCGKIRPHLPSGRTAWRTCPPSRLQPEDYKDGKSGSVRLLVRSGLVESNGEARRLIKSGEVRIDNVQHTDSDPEPCRMRGYSRRLASAALLAWKNRTFLCPLHILVERDYNAGRGTGAEAEEKTQKALEQGFNCSGAFLVCGERSYLLDHRPQAAAHSAADL